MIACRPYNTIVNNLTLLRKHGILHPVTCVETTPGYIIRIQTRRSPRACSLNQRGVFNIVVIQTAYFHLHSMQHQWHVALSDLHYGHNQYLLAATVRSTDAKEPKD